MQQSLAASAAGGARPPARQPAPLRACAPAAHGGPRRAPCLNASERCPARPGPAPGGASLASAGAPPPASPPSPDMRRSQGAARPQAKSQGGRARAFGSTPSTGGAPLARAAASSASACARPSSPFWRAWKVSSTPQRCRHGSASACSSAAARGARAPGLAASLKAPRWAGPGPASAAAARTASVPVAPQWRCWHGPGRALARRRAEWQLRAGWTQSVAEALPTRPKRASRACTEARLARPRPGSPPSLAEGRSGPGRARTLLRAGEHVKGILGEEQDCVCRPRQRVSRGAEGAGARPGHGGACHL